MKMMIAAVGMSLGLIAGQGGAAIAADHAQAEHCKGVRSRVCGQDMTDVSQHDHAGHGAMHHGHDASKEKLDWAGLSKHMEPMMKMMTGMNQRLAEMMASEAAGTKMTELGGLMDEMSSHMLRMADVMNNGGASEAEMHSMHMGIDETAKTLGKIR